MATEATALLGMKVSLDACPLWPGYACCDADIHAGFIIKRVVGFNTYMSGLKCYYCMYVCIYASRRIIDPSARLHSESPKPRAHISSSNKTGKSRPKTNKTPMLQYSSPSPLPHRHICPTHPTLLHHTKQPPRPIMHTNPARNLMHAPPHHLTLFRHNN